MILKPPLVQTNRDDHHGLVFYRDEDLVAPDEGRYDEDEDGILIQEPGVDFVRPMFELRSDHPATREFCRVCEQIPDTADERLWGRRELFWDRNSSLSYDSSLSQRAHP